MTIISLFDPLPPYQSRNETSELAAISVIGKTKSLREKVYQALLEQDMTDEQIAFRLDMNPSTARPRRVELLRQGLIEQVGIAKTSSGRVAALWGVTTNKEAS